MTKQSVSKTNAMRTLDRRGIEYQTFTYDESIKTANGAAAAIGADVQDVFKTLVLLRSEGRPLLLMVPGDKEVDMRALASEIGCKDVRLAPQREAERMTGLQIGGIGALALLDRPFDVMIDRVALAREAIYVNGGRRGLNLHLSTVDLIEVTGACVVAVTERHT